MKNKSIHLQYPRSLQHKQSPNRSCPFQICNFCLLWIHNVKLHLALENCPCYLLESGNPCKTIKGYPTNSKNFYITGNERANISIRNTLAHYIIDNLQRRLAYAIPLLSRYVSPTLQEFAMLRRILLGRVFPTNFLKV